MTEPTRYDVVTAASERGLIDMVNVMMASGWQPVGGMSVRVEERGVFKFYQSLVKLPPVPADPADLDEPGYAVRNAANNAYTGAIDAVRATLHRDG